MPFASPRPLSRLVALAAALATAPLGAVTTDIAAQQTYANFEDGTFENIALPGDGGLRLAPAMERVAKLDASVIWNAAADSAGNIYVGTGNSGKVFKIAPDGKSEMIFQPEEILTHALALDAAGNLYIGTSPEGRVYRLAPGGRPEIYFDPGDTYIWDLAFDKEGRLYVATGARGRVYRLPPDFRQGQSAPIFFESDRTHLTTLAFDNAGRLLVGAGPRSLLYRVTSREEVEVLANPNTDEITGIVPAADGKIYFSTFNKNPASGGARGAGAASSGAASASSSSSSGSARDDDEPTTLILTPPSRGAGPGSSGGVRSELQCVSPDGFVETLWAQARVGIYSMRALPGGGWLLGTDQQGRIFRASGLQDWELLQQATDSSEVSMLLPAPGEPDSTLIFSSNPAQVFRLGAKPAASGSYTAEPFDADQPARWGTVRALANPPRPGSPLAGAKWETRSGNTPRPDSTWNAWAPVSAGAQIASPAARYLQYRVKLDEAGVILRSLAIYFQHFNAAPQVLRVGVVPVGVEVITPPAPTRGMVDVRALTDSDVPALPTPLAPRPQLRPTGDPGSFTAGWRAGDPNGDALLYSVQLRAVGEEKWVTLADELADSVYSFSSRGFKDGYYELRINATDKLDNPTGEARESARVSAPFLVDNSAPEVTLESQSGDSARYTLTLRARDSASVLVSANYTIDGQTARPALPEGALFDKPELTFRVRLDRLKPGPHSLVLEVTDAAGNTGAAKTAFETP